MSYIKKVTNSLMLNLVGKFKGLVGREGREDLIYTGI
jgi:hypothetical protein